MSGLRVKETMEQIHIPEEMREQIILNVQDRMKAGTAGRDGTGKAGTAGGAGTGKAGTARGTGAGKAETARGTGAGKVGTARGTGAGKAGTAGGAGTGKAGTARGTGTGKAGTAGKVKIGKAETAGGAKTENRRAYSARRTHGTRRACSTRRRAAAVAAFVLVAGLVGIPVQAFVRNLVAARMEEIPEEEVRDMAQLIQEQKVEADTFSRELTSGEKERMKELQWLYQNGIFPEKTLPLADSAAGAAEGSLYYIWETGLFCMPERELTDEEVLEIIDFNFTRSYAIEQSPGAQEARQERQEEQARRRERLQAAGGICEETAVEIAANRMKEELGESAEGKEELRVSLADISDEDYDHRGEIGYMVVFRNPRDCTSYICMVDSMDGSVLKTYQVK